MKQPLLKGKSDAVQAILTSMDKTPEADIITEGIRTGEALSTAFRNLGRCSARVGIGLMQENPESIETEVRSLMMIFLIITSLPLQRYQ